MLYTRKGDKGTAKLFTSKKGERLSKTSAIFEALGTVDELNSFLGLCKIESKKSNIILQGGKLALGDVVHRVQENLFIIQAELAGSEMSIEEEKVKRMEEIIDGIEQELPPIKTFFIPGGAELAARFDIARTLARRAERRVLSAAEENEELIESGTKVYLNRLSSLLYACVRLVNHRAGIEERPPEYK